jgi:polyhydroxyalkanoate synthesis regulator phasin
MQTKLTLRLADELIRKAKRFSKETGKSVSMIVADYFEKLDVPPQEEIKGITPKVAALRGILKRTGAEEEEYYHHLEEKHL